MALVQLVTQHTEGNQQWGQGWQMGGVADLLVPPCQPAGSDHPMVNREMGEGDGQERVWLQRVGEHGPDHKPGQGLSLCINFLYQASSITINDLRLSLVPLL